MSVCVDASLLVKLVTPEFDSERVHDWFVAHRDQTIIAPAFMPVEVASVIRQKIVRKQLTEEQGEQAVSLLGGLDIQIYWDWLLVERALALAAELNQPTAYDTAYLALAEQEECDLLTADVAFARACSSEYPRVRVL